MKKYTTLNRGKNDGNNKSYVFDNKKVFIDHKSESIKTEDHKLYLESVNNTEKLVSER